LLSIVHLKSLFRFNERKFLPQFDWKWIDYVKYQTYDRVRCPICMSSNFEMVNPHITFCGHIFCLYCIVRHLQNGREKCPVCLDSCSFIDLKTIEVENLQEPEKRQKIRFTLMKKFQRSYEISPASVTTESINKFKKIFSISIEEREKTSSLEIDRLVQFQASEDFQLSSVEAQNALEKSFAIILSKSD
jgi:hypothetical protein